MLDKLKEAFFNLAIFAAVSLITLSLWAVGLQGFQLSYNDTIYQKANGLAEHYNKWAEYLRSDERLGQISPYSPEFKHLVEKRWNKEGLSNRWRALEKAVIE